MTAIHRDSSVLEASRVMRECDAAEVLVASDGGPLGVLTARDIVVRVLAVGLDPAVLTAGDIVTD
ncbi:MAG TPA: CBS domain-containing protein [Burkholderiales bacterium]|nr:CBS domain-containing protein [Burkholderiales bacterium]